MANRPEEGITNPTFSAGYLMLPNSRTKNICSPIGLIIMQGNKWILV